ncbi:flagellar export protein FliJ [Enterobacter cloacae]|uniref:Flagellar FliJ protein n=1 Tax=Enterobacter cloacae subsp. cloacae TaxID=336306 RepID=A0AAE2EGJ2_ENTCL|nr:flagellar export protein FliJ [Enterobacter cloacae]EGQ5296525.1 flagellar export protein FliJ [Enterobacter cloacae]KJM41061.1 flagellar biosynthesis protein FliJ [Enterobacter cloacae subsp. cloacae]KLQ14615.1 flagellar biosynthesis protein FliJ [Enterobacter cloacae subsp. cloacae]MCK6709308.1 flagellar export protein FliJ [Enterobacter cloacae]MCL8316373.1 flagellar export protein FliJ [Enterobacter cloacae subsp. cloacae]
MKAHNPMVLLRDKAQETLTQTTRALGGAQQQLQQAMTQHEQLQHYEQEYQQSLRQGMMSDGMSVADLVNHQSFILSLKQVVKQQAGHVNACEKAVDEVKKNWVQNKQRLNAFETLIERRATAQALVQSRHEQKLMDEFAQRAGQKRERL